MYFCLILDIKEQENLDSKKYNQLIIRKKLIGREYEIDQSQDALNELNRKISSAERKLKSPEMNEDRRRQEKELLMKKQKYKINELKGLKSKLDKLKEEWEHVNDSQKYLAF